MADMGWDGLDHKPAAISQGIRADLLLAAALKGTAPLLAAMADAAPPQIADRDIEAAVVAVDADHVEIAVSVTGDDAVLDEPAQASMMRGVAAETQAALDDMAAEVAKALDRLEAR